MPVLGLRPGGLHHLKDGRTLPGGGPARQAAPEQLCLPVSGRNEGAPGREAMRVGAQAHECVCHLHQGQARQGLVLELLATVVLPLCAIQALVVANAVVVFGSDACHPDTGRSNAPPTLGQIPGQLHLLH